MIVDILGCPGLLNSRQFPNPAGRYRSHGRSSTARDEAEISAVSAPHIPRFRGRRAAAGEETATPSREGRNPRADGTAHVVDTPFPEPVRQVSRNGPVPAPRGADRPSRTAA